MDKFQKFWMADVNTGNLVTQVQEKFGKWGGFHIDNADFILRLSKQENTSPELIAVTWMNETSFRFYSEPNKNHQPTNFDKWDVGPFQMNVGLLHANLLNAYLSDKGLVLKKITGSPVDFFDGDPYENGRMASRMLNRIGRPTIVGPNQSVLFEPLTIQVWNALPNDLKNERKAVAYTGPDARPSRLTSWRKFGPLFKKFFELYQL